MIVSMSDASSARPSLWRCRNAAVSVYEYGATTGASGLMIVSAVSVMVTVIEVGSLLQFVLGEHAIVTLPMLFANTWSPTLKSADCDSTTSPVRSIPGTMG